MGDPPPSRPPRRSLVSGSFNDERPFFRVYEGATGHFWRKADPGGTQANGLGVTKPNEPRCRISPYKESGMHYSREDFGTLSLLSAFGEIQDPEKRRGN